MKEPDQKPFREAYEKLKTNAETLREQEEPDIDNLLQIVTESIDAYAVCKDRIDAVEQALNKAFARKEAQLAAKSETSPATEEGEPADGGAKPKRRGGKFDNSEEDIPF